MPTAKPNESHGVISSSTVMTSQMFYLSKIQWREKINYYFYGQQEKFMFSEAPVCELRGGELGRSPLSGRRPPPLDGDPLELTSNGGHYSGRYASYWNEFL